MKQTHWMQALCALALVGCQGESNLKVNPICSTGMVIQQLSSVSVSGTASPGVRVNVKTDWDVSISTSAGEDSVWSVSLATPAADNASHTISLETKDTTIILKDILLGEVWVAAGQSNIEMPLGGWGTDSVAGASEAILNSADSLLRFFTIKHSVAFHEQRSIEGKWRRSKPNTTRHVSAMAYFFAKELRDSLKVPVGIIQATFGGAPARAWTSLESTKDFPEFEKIKRELEEQELDYNSYRQWLDSLPSQLIVDENGKDILQNTTVYDDYVNMRLPDVSAWDKMPVPGYWENHGLKGFDGIVWFAHTVDIPKHWVGQELTLHLGCVDDRDVTYVNQTQVGAHDGPNSFMSQRIYKVPANAVSTDKLNIMVRVTDERAGGGIVGCPDGKSIRVELNENESVSLEGEWHYCVAGQIDGQRLILFDLPNQQFCGRKVRTIAPSPEAVSLVYNATICPLEGLNVAGVIWHQGEADVWSEVHRKNEQYYLDKIMDSFRKKIGNKKLPFIVAQISNGTYHGLDKSTCAEVRVGQQLAVQNTEDAYLVPTLELGSVTSLRPPHKQIEAHRLALCALGNIYGRKGFVCNAPMPISATTGHQIVNIKFANGERMTLDTSKPTEFEVAGADSMFYPAKALVSPGAVTVFSHLVPEPVFVRYAFHNWSEAPLRGENGMGAPTFFIKAEPAKDSK